MTDEENQRCAINYLIELKKSTKGYGANWLELAIKALEQQPITWIVGKENCQVAVRNMPTDKMQKICAIIGEEEQQPCEDCVSREAVITKIEDEDKLSFMGCFCSHDAAMGFRETIKELPSVQPQTKRGKWIATNDYVTTAYGSLDYYRCSCCREDSLEKGDFCPNCGADMREVQDDD